MKNKKFAYRFTGPKRSLTGYRVAYDIQTTRVLTKVSKTDSDEIPIWRITGGPADGEEYLNDTEALDRAETSLIEIGGVYVDKCGKSDGDDDFDPSDD